MVGQYVDSNGVHHDFVANPNGATYTATFTGAANTDISNAAVSVTAGSWSESNGNPGSGGSTPSFTVDTAPAANSTITATPASLTADGTSTTTLTVTVKDAEGNVIPDASVSLSSTDAGDAFGVTSGTTKRRRRFYDHTVIGTPRVRHE